MRSPQRGKPGNPWIHARRGFVSTGLTPLFKAMFGDGSLYPTVGSNPFTITRATPTSVETSDVRVVQLNTAEAGFAGARRVENLLPFPEDLENAGWSATNITVTSGITDPDDGTSAYTLTADANSVVFFDTVTVGASGEYRPSVWIKRRTGTGNVQIRDAGNANTETLPLTSGWKRFTHSAPSGPSGSTGYLVILIATSGDEIDVWQPQLENVTDKIHKAPSEYVSVGVGVQPDILGGVTGFAEINNWSISGDTLVAASVSAFNSTSKTGFGLRNGVDYELTFTVSGHSGSGDLVGYLGTNGSSSVATDTITADGTYTKIITNDGLDALYFRSNDGSNVLNATISDITVRAADHGANIDGVKYFNTHNANTVSSNVVTEATGPAITDSNSKFANFDGSGDTYSQADSAANSFTSDFVGWAYVAAADWDGGTQNLVSKFQSYTWGIDFAGRQYLSVTQSSSASTSTCDDAVDDITPDRGGVWLGVWFDASASEVRFYEASLWHGSTFSELEAVKTQTGATESNANSGIDDTANALTLFSGLEGRGYKAFLASDTSGTGLITFDANDTTGWTENGNAYITTPPLNPDGTGPAGLQVAFADTNTFTYSEDFSNAAWTKANSTTGTSIRAAGYVLDNLKDDNSTGTGAVTFTQAITVASGGDSIIVRGKAGTLGHMYVTTANFDAGGNGTSWVNLNTGAAGTTSGNHTVVVTRLADGAVEVEVTFSSTTDLTGDVSAGVADADNDTTVDLDNTSDIYAGSIQHGGGPYVKTEASSQARNAEVLTYTGLSGLDSAHSLYVEGTIVSLVDTPRVCALSDGTAANRAEVAVSASTSRFRNTIRAAGVEVALLSPTTAYSSGDSFKAGVSLAEDDGEAYTEGDPGATDTSMAMPTGLDDFAVGNSTGVVNGWQYISEVSIYDKRLTDSEQSGLAS